MTAISTKELGNRVLAKIGKPTGFIKVEVRPLWAGKFRVNVWANVTTDHDIVGGTTSEPRIVHSEIVEDEPGTEACKLTTSAR